MRIALFALVVAASAQDWPSFRGPTASGVADGQNLPVQWDAQQRVGVLWKTEVHGLAHSSPVVWGDQVFLTTAVSGKPDATFKAGLYGEGTASDDLSVHHWNVLCLDRATGRVLWERTAYQGVPKEKCHIKSTYANATPATDGRVVVAFFGSQGLYAYDPAGNLLWKRDLGRFDCRGLRCARVRVGHGQFAYGRALDKGRIGQTPNKKAEHTEALQKTPRFQHDTVWGLYDIPDEVRWACRRRAGIGEGLL